MRRIAPGDAYAKASATPLNSGDRLPYRRPFILDRSFPVAVRGPVDFFALRRLASRRASVMVGDFRSGMRPLTRPRQTPLAHEHEM
ncbi:MAG TPA: hypothetical protein VMT20_22450 [Terriglobia bacterium]|nr:hypothetical protein [Terriglobia bacterium]